MNWMFHIIYTNTPLFEKDRFTIIRCLPFSSQQFLNYYHREFVKVIGSVWVLFGIPWIIFIHYNISDMILTGTTIFLFSISLPYLFLILIFFKLRSGDFSDFKRDQSLFSSEPSNEYASQKFPRIDHILIAFFILYFAVAIGDGIKSYYYLIGSLIQLLIIGFLVLYFRSIVRAIPRILA